MKRGCWMALTCCLAAAPVPAAGPPVIVAQVQERAFSEAIEALGTLRANESVEVTASVTETVTAVRFNDGDQVDAGSVLVEMTSAEEQALLKEARATVAEAKRQYQRIRQLESQGTASRSLYDQRRREWETATARLAVIESRIADRLIRAPFAGTVGLRRISPGALVEPGDVITTLDDNSVMKLDFTVPATLLAVLRQGLPVEARTRAYAERTFSGEVVAVDSRVDPVTRSITVRALLPNPDAVLKPGMLMQVQLRHGARQGLAVPEAALLAEGQSHFVWVVDPQEELAQRRPVQIGLRLSGTVEVVGGLRKGDRVITEGALKVRPGQPVTVRAVDNDARPLRELLARPASAAPQ